VPDPATNHVGVTDANGNLAGYSYDVENRVLGGGGVNYNYAPGNKRLMRASCCTTENQTGYNFPVASEEVTFWSVSGQRMATYTIAPNSYIGSAVQTTASMTSGWNVISVASSTGIGVGQTVEGNGIPANTTVTGISYNNITLSANLTASGSGVSVTFLSTSLQLVATQTGTWYYFGGKLIKNKSGYVGTDRLGSIGHFYPYGQEKPSATQNGTEKFTGYLRDAETGMDYANQRYHVPGTGRFLTPDPYRGSARPSMPSSWNKYAYVRGDPVNHTDRTGLVEDCDDGDEYGDCDGWSGGGGGGGEGEGYCDVYPDDPICNPYPTNGYCTPGNPLCSIATYGSSSQDIKVTNFSNSGPKQDSITKALQKIEDALGDNSQCANWLGASSGPESAAALINDLIQANGYGYGTFNVNTVAAFAGQNNADGTPTGTGSSAAITVNANGAFFNSGFTVGIPGYTGGSLQAQLTILIHELAHLESNAGTGASGFQPDAGNPSAGKSNDTLVNKNCGNLINSIH
jgi:RHS repeat-associated protein